MKFKEKYCNTKDKNKPENQDKTILSDDAYSIAETVDNLINKIEHVRMGL